MSSTSLKIRLPSEDLELWKHGAQLAGITLSEWIRRKCNGESIVTAPGARFGSELPDVPRGDRRERARTPGRFKQAVDVAHQVGRKHAETHLSSPRPTGEVRQRQSTADQGEPGSAPREPGTPEVAGGIERGPYDALAQKGSVFAHTAASHRLTCLCPSCVDYRHKNQLPVGGLPKKAKR
jgi:hypothetical protein